jgi:hypothetical protein
MTSSSIVPFQPRVPAYTMADLERAALAIAGSKLFGIQTPDQALALCLVARAEGRDPASAAQDYNIIQGRPAKKADAMLRDFISSGGKVQWHALDNETADATFSHPSGGTVRIDWTLERAKAAGLGGKDMWKKFPRQMLRSRVVSEGVRTVCPGATSGMYVPEEVQEFEPVQATVRDVTDEPDFTGVPQPRKSAHQARKDGDYERLTTGLRACQSEQDLHAWAKAESDALGAIPAGWAKEIRQEWVELRDGFRARSADPYGLFIEPPADDTPEAWTAYVDEVLTGISGAPDADQVTAAQTVNAEGLTLAMAGLEGVAERIAEAAEQRLAFLASRQEEAA